MIFFEPVDFNLRRFSSLQLEKGWSAMSRCVVHAHKAQGLLLLPLLDLEGRGTASRDETEVVKTRLPLVSLPWRLRAMDGSCHVVLCPLYRALLLIRLGVPQDANLPPGQSGQGMFDLLFSLTDLTRISPFLVLVVALGSDYHFCFWTCSQNFIPEGLLYHIANSFDLCQFKILNILYI